MSLKSAAQLLRADQLLSRFGYCSRREARAWLRAGRVTMDGRAVADPGERISPASVLVDGAPVEFAGGLFVLFHKPAGFTCSHDEREGPRIYDQLPARWLQRQPPATSVGRLDRDATGLLLITDDGAWVHRLTSPRHKVSKVYEVEVAADLDPRMVEVFASGRLRLDGESKPCLPARLEIRESRSARLELTEGRFHQVKRMFASEGCPVIRLHRIRFGPYELGDLPVGQWKSVEPPTE